MPKLDLSKLKKTADSMVKSVQDNLPDSMKNVDVKESVKEMAIKGSKALAKFAKESTDTDQRVNEVLNDNDGNRIISVKDALQVFYLLMAVDGSIDAEELDRFVSIGNELDSSFEEHRSVIIDDCESVIGKSVDSEDRYDLVHDKVGDILRSSSAEGKNVINGKLLLWDLLVIAYSNEKFSKDEERLIRYITRVLDVDPVIISEMELAIKTVKAIEEEEAFLKNSDRRYAEIEPKLDELQDRKNVVIQSAYALVLD